MPETAYLADGIRNILKSMTGPKEKIALFLGERVSDDEIYVTNTTGAFEGEATSVSIDRIFHADHTLGAIINANRHLREREDDGRFVVFACHSHPSLQGEIINRGATAWSVDDVPGEYEGLRGTYVQLRDRGGSLISFMLKDVSDGKGGDDIFMEMVANKWRIIEYQFFVRPPDHLAGKPMQGEVAVDCYRYDPQMRLGKIRKIPIAEKALNPQDLMKTILDSTKIIWEIDKTTGYLVLPYRR